MQNRISADVLIIGGGFAGVTVAQALEKQGIKTLLTDKKNYFEVTFATLRNIAAPEKTGNQSRKLYRDFLSGEFIQSGVTHLREKEATLENGDSVHFSQAVIASGTRYPTLPIAKTNDAMNISDRNQELLDSHSRLRQASKVLIIGGGVVGVELAGEIAYAMPNTEVTLAHGNEQLLDGFKPKAQRKAQEQLSALGVKLKFNTRFQKEGDIYRDKISGSVSDADIVFPATGVLPNNEFLIQDMEHILNDRGFIKVNQYLEIENYSHLYALGDIADVGEAKLGYLAQQQGDHLAKLIAEKLKQPASRKKTKSKPYKRNPLMALIPVGQKKGVVQLPFAVTTLKPLVNMKQKDLFINKIYSAFGTEPGTH